MLLLPPSSDITSVVYPRRPLDNSSLFCFFLCLFVCFAKRFRLYWDENQASVTVILRIVGDFLLISGWFLFGWTNSCIFILPTYVCAEEVFIVLQLRWLASVFCVYHCVPSALADRWVELSLSPHCSSCGRRGNGGYIKRTATSSQALSPPWLADWSPVFPLFLSPDIHCPPCNHSHRLCTPL